MVQKVNGGIEKGVWVERDVSFVKLKFSADISDSAFGIPNSCLDNAIQKLVERKATVLAVSELYDGDATGDTVDVMLGHAQGWYSAADDGEIATGLDVTGFEADLETEVSATVTIQFAVFSGLREATSADMVAFEDTAGYGGTDYFPAQ